MPSICTLHFVQGKRQISRGTGSFWRRQRKSALQQMLYVLDTQKGIHLTREGERLDTGLNYLCAGNATTGVHIGEGLTRQPNEPVAY